MQKGEMHAVLVGCSDEFVCEEDDGNEEPHSVGARPLPLSTPKRVIGWEGDGSAMPTAKTSLILSTFENFKIFATCIQI